LPRPSSRASGAKNVGGATAVDLFGRRSSVKLIDEKWKMKRVLDRIVKRDITILGVQDFFQGLVNAIQKLVQIGGLVEGVDYIGNNLALRLHAVKICHVQVGRDDAFDGRIVEAIPYGALEPAQGTVLAAETAALDDGRARGGSQFGKPGAGLCRLGRMKKVSDGTSDHLFG